MRLLFLSASALSCVVLHSRLGGQTLATALQDEVEEVGPWAPTFINADRKSCLFLLMFHPMLDSRNCKPFVLERMPVACLL